MLTVETSRKETGALRRLGALPATALFRRRDNSAPPARTASEIACTMRGCNNQTAELCAYRDRRDRTCSATICPAHIISLGGITYCRRHAGTVQAIGELARDPSGRPDVDDRAPSLVDWIGRDLDKDIRRLLARTVRPGESLIVDDAVRLAHDPFSLSHKARERLPPSFPRSPWECRLRRSASAGGTRSVPGGIPTGTVGTRPSVCNARENRCNTKRSAGLDRAWRAPLWSVLSTGSLDGGSSGPSRRKSKTLPGNHPRNRRPTSTGGTRPGA